MSEIFLDTETTGLSFQEGHKIVEIACIETKDLIPTNKKFHCYLNGMLLRRGVDYTAGSPIVLSTAAKAGDEVAIMNANAEEFFTANEGQTKFTATDTSTTSDNTQVYLNGVFQEIGTDYTLGNPSVTVINPATGLTEGDNFDIVITR